MAASRSTEGLLLPTGMASWNGRLYVADLGHADVVEVSPATGKAAFVGGRDGAGPRLRCPFDLSVHPGGQLLVLDLGHHAIVAVDPQTGDRAIWADLRDSAAGAPVQTPLGIAVDAKGRVFVLDRGENRVVTVAPDGQRRVLSNAAAGPPMRSPLALAVLRDSDLAVIDPDAKTVFRIDPETGRRSLITSTQPDHPRGDGPTLSEPVDLIERPDGTLWLGDLGAQMVLAVDPTTGDRRPLATPGRGPAIELLWSMCSTEDQRVFYVDRNKRCIVEINDVGDREQRTPDATPSAFLQPYDLVAAGPHGVRVMDRGRQAAIDVDAETGAIVSATPMPGDDQAGRGRAFGTTRGADGWLWTDYPNRCLWAQPDGAHEPRVVSGGLEGESVGAGDSFEVPAGLCRVGETAYVVDAARQAIITVDLRTGNRQWLSGRGDGRGPNFARIMHVRAAAGELFCCDMEQSAVFAIDVATGVRRILSGAGVGYGPALRKPLGLDVDAAGRTIYAADFARNDIVAIDIATGRRTTVSDNHGNEGEAFTMPIAVSVFDADRLVVTDLTHAALFWVDRISGTRTRLTRPDATVAV